MPTFSGTLQAFISTGLLRTRPQAGSWVATFVAMSPTGASPVVASTPPRSGRSTPSRTLIVSNVGAA